MVVGHVGPVYSKDFPRNCVDKNVNSIKQANKNQLINEMKIFGKFYTEITLNKKLKCHLDQENEDLKVFY